NEHQNELAEKDAEIKSKNNKIKELENQVTNLNQKLPTIQQEKQNNLDLFCEISTRRNFSSVIIKQLSVEEKTAISQ
ncbi:25757_t:CDS:1, partial [Racocetra persica]